MGGAFLEGYTLICISPCLWAEPRLCARCDKRLSCLCLCQLHRDRRLLCVSCTGTDGSRGAFHSHSLPVFSNGLFYVVYSFKCFFDLFYFIYMRVLWVYMYVCYMHAWYPWRPEDSVWSVAALIMFVNHHVGVGSSARSASILNHGAMTPSNVFLCQSWCKMMWVRAGVHLSRLGLLRTWGPWPISSLRHANALMLHLRLSVFSVSSSSFKARQCC